MFCFCSSVSVRYHQVVWNEVMQRAKTKNHWLAVILPLQTEENTDWLRYCHHGQRKTLIGQCTARETLIGYSTAWTEKNTDWMRYCPPQTVGNTAWLKYCPHGQRKKHWLVEVLPSTDRGKHWLAEVLPSWTERQEPGSAVLNFGQAYTFLLLCYRVRDSLPCFHQCWSLV